MRRHGEHRLAAVDPDDRAAGSHLLEQLCNVEPGPAAHVQDAFARGYTEGIADKLPAAQHIARAIEHFKPSRGALIEFDLAHPLNRSAEATVPGDHAFPSPPGKTPPVSDQRLLKTFAVTIAFALGALAAFGCLVAALFEIQGFGGPRDQGPRSGYLVELALGFAASVLVPVWLWRRLLGGGPGWIVAGAAAVAGVMIILGISLSS